MRTFGARDEREPWTTRLRFRTEVSTLSWRSLTRKFAPTPPPPTTTTTTPSLSCLFLFCPPNSSCPKRHLHPMQHKLVSACFEASSDYWSLPFLLLAPLHSKCFEKGRKKRQERIWTCKCLYILSQLERESFSFSFCSPYLGFWLTLFVSFAYCCVFCVSCFFHSLRACLKL